MIYDGHVTVQEPSTCPDTMTVRTLPLLSATQPGRYIWDDIEKFFANIVFESMDAVENKISEACLHTRRNVRSITAFPWIADNL